MSLVHPVNTSLCLEKICETNYRKLFRLIPNILSFRHTAIGHTQHKPSLFLDVIERSPYTLTVELSHCFQDKLNLNTLLEPAVKIRIYLDAQLAEALGDYARAAVKDAYPDPRRSQEIKNYKWRLNYFLEKWLDHCLLSNYSFIEKIDSDSPRTS